MQHVFKNSVRLCHIKTNLSMFPNNVAVVVDNAPGNAYAYPNMIATLTTTQDIFRAFADPTRLRILNLLIEGEVCVCDLCTVLDEIQPKISRHLAYLRRAGLVEVRQDGKWKHYQIKRGAKGLERTLITCVKSCLREMDILQEDLERLRSGRGACCE